MMRSIVAIALLVTAAAAFAQELDGLRESFRARYPELVAAKRAGAIGENSAGFVEAVKGGSAELVNAENADRRKLYAALAAKENISPEQVAQRNAQRNFGKAQPGEWLKGGDGKWTQKR
jgi:hypothetical protein